jgi:hypothetical protein
MHPAGDATYTLRVDGEVIPPSKRLEIIVEFYNAMPDVSLAGKRART